MRPSLDEQRTPYIRPLPSADVVLPDQPEEEPLPDWETLLFNNQNLGIHRFAFLLKKFPGLFMILVSTWTLFGRGKDDTNTLASENNMGIATLVAGALVTLTTLAGAQNHNNSPKNAFNQSLLRVGSSVLNIIVVIASTVFAAIALGDLRGLTEEVYPACYPTTCMSVNERITHSGVILGLGILILALSIFAITYGIYAALGVRRDHKQRRLVEKKNRDAAAAYDNSVGAINYAF